MCDYYSAWPNGVVVNVLDCDIIVSEVELQSHYYVHFRIHSFRKGMNSIIPVGRSAELLNTLTAPLQRGKTPK